MAKATTTATKTTPTSGKGKGKGAAPAVEAKPESKRMKGTTLELSVRDTWRKLFNDNEAAPVAKKQTDDLISAFMVAEFPSPTGDVPFDYTPEGISRVRSWFNRTNCGEGTPPTRLSYRYDESGTVIGGPRGWKGTGEAPAKGKGKGAPKAEAPAAPAPGKGKGAAPAKGKGK